MTLEQLALGMIVAGAFLLVIGTVAAVAYQTGHTTGYLRAWSQRQDDRESGRPTDPTRPTV